MRANIDSKLNFDDHIKTVRSNPSNIPKALVGAIPYRSIEQKLLVDSFFNAQLTAVHKYECYLVTVTIVSLEISMKDVFFIKFFVYESNISITYDNKLTLVYPHCEVYNTIVKVFRIYDVKIGSLFIQN